ncbi:MAG: 3-phosphoshikimate 1-carboxyvinyltransferase [bacterium]|nr:3-phosphoshikimate 1-carboxyvinyltransferase [bacterium]MDY4101133.1 3-phosphoshikimate 1-carboxyvinyltransferase [Lachnospiraceae bacterium]
MNITKSAGLRGELAIPGDKSICHRAIMFGALAEGTTEITNFLQGADCLSTISCFQAMGVDIENNIDRVLIHGAGLHGLKAPSSMLDVGNSGTTTRLISGILAGQAFTSTLNGDASIQKRPMKRIMDPLTLMGAEIKSINNNGCAPLEIRGGHLHGISYQSPVASAQVKSCVLLAGLYADGKTSVTEPVLSRNHTELMLAGFGAKVTSEGTTATIEPEPKLYGQQISVPGDISSAAYWIAAALAVPNSELVLKNVGINPTRDGILRVVEAMGADITRENVHTVSGELVCDLIVRSSSLHGATVSGELIPTLIDEIPVIAVLSCFAEGETIIRDAQELKVKESNRIDTVVEGLLAMGADATATDDGMIIRGGRPLHGATIDSHLDHRIAMSFAVAGLMCDTPTTILNADSVVISYPDFYESLKKVSL